MHFTRDLGNQSWVGRWVSLWYSQMGYKKITQQENPGKNNNEKNFLDFFTPEKLSLDVNFSLLLGRI